MECPDWSAAERQEKPQACEGEGTEGAGENTEGVWGGHGG